MAHIVEYSKSKDNTAENLLLLCANCHTRSHAEKWDRKTLRYYRDHPFVARDRGFSRWVQNLRYSTLGNDFVGREDTMVTLHESLFSGNATALKGHALYGLGGVGKTRTAIEYAWRYRSEYSALLMIDADSPAGLSRSLAGLCASDLLDLAEKESSDESVQKRGVLRWFERHRDWLLIVDNADSDEALVATEALLPYLTGGHVLATTRLTNLTGSFRTVALDVLSEEAGLVYVSQRTDGHRTLSANDPVDIATLVRHVGGLALALEQAVAYIRRTRCSIVAYLERWNSHTADTLRWHDEFKMHYPRSLAVTFDTSFAQLSEGAKSLLALLAWFAPDPIPYDLIELADNPAEMGICLSELENLSLAKRSDHGSEFSLHRVVQEIARQQQSEEQTSISLNTSVRLTGVYLAREFENDFNLDKLDLIAPHVETVGMTAARHGIYRPSAAALGDLSLYLRRRARFDSSERLARHVLILHEQSGSSPDDLCPALNNLGLVLQEAGKYGEAEDTYERVLALISTQGASYSFEATVLRHLAIVHVKTGRLSLAETGFRKALSIAEPVEGKDSVSVAFILSDLGELLMNVGKLSEAETLIEQGLQTLESISPAEPTYLAGAYNNLGQIKEAMGFFAEAEQAFRRSLLLSRNSLGDEHPDVAVRQNNLAGILRNTNRVQEAEALYRRALAIDEKAYGPAHPEVATDLVNLGSFLGEHGSVVEAEIVLRRSLRIWESSFTEAHPGWATCYNNLGCVLSQQSKNSDAKECYEKALAIHLEVLGESHPSVAQDLWNLASAHASDEKYQEAAIALKRALKVLIQAFHVSGILPPGIGKTATFYVLCLEKQGKTTEFALKKANKILRAINIQMQPPASRLEDLDLSPSPV
jgi:tetratricopeptide (TPR) repeat protein